GLVRGGDGQQLLWQVRQLVWLPWLVLLASHAFTTTKYQWHLAVVVMLAALCRAAVGIYYYYAICQPLAYQPAYVTTHGDSVLFVVALVIPLLLLMERPGVFSALLCLLVGPP